MEFDGWAGKHSIQLDFNVPAAARAREGADPRGGRRHLLLPERLPGQVRALGGGYPCAEPLGHILEPHAASPDTVWKDRPGWAPCAEDITGLSVRNGSLAEPENLNGVPLDYFPGFILALGTLRRYSAAAARGRRLQGHHLADARRAVPARVRGPLRADRRRARRTQQLRGRAREGRGLGAGVSST